VIGAAEDAARNAILDHGPQLSTTDLTIALTQRRERSN
jgi:hypothetical protein